MPSIITTNNSLPVMEAFYTLQGEGFYQGNAAYFVRLAGCDVGCFWCDVKESWDEGKHPVLSIENILQQIKSSPAEIAVITGGEPLMHNLDALTQTLQANHIKTHIETSAAFPLSGKWDWICVSPKKFKKPLAETLAKADELKVVVYNKTDFAWARENALHVHENCKLYLQPEWGAAEKITPLIIDFIKANPHWQLSLQIHKYINVP